MKKTLLSGIVLLILSVPFLFPMIREDFAAHCFHSRYELRELYQLYPHELKPIQQLQFGGNKIELSDEFMSGQYSEEDRREGPVAIRINGRNRSYPSTVEIRPFFHDENRYHTWIGLIELKDRRLNESRFAVVQRIIDADKDQSIEETRFRILFMDPKGIVEEEIFSYPERASPVYRTNLAAYVMPRPIGYYSDVYAVWPTLLYPFIYPWLTGVLGAILVITSGISIAMRRGRLKRLGQH